MGPPTSLPLSAVRLPREPSPAPLASGARRVLLESVKQAEGGREASPALLCVEDRSLSHASLLRKASLASQQSGDREPDGGATVSSGSTGQTGRKRSAEAPAVDTPTTKRPKTPSAASTEAVALGYELGTIKNAAYILLTRAGVSGLTVSNIVELATREGLYSWGTCKTPNNSVTAALSQDQNFIRVAPSTYALRNTLRPVGAAAQREASGQRHAVAGVAPETRAAAAAHSHNLRHGVPDTGRARTSSEAEPAPQRRPSALRLDGRGGSFSMGHEYPGDRSLAGDASQSSGDDLLHEARSMGMEATSDPLGAAVPSSPNTPSAADLAREQPPPPTYSPTLGNAASCLFLFPVAHPYIPTQPAGSPDTPTEAEQRAELWRDEVFGLDGVCVGADAALAHTLALPALKAERLPLWVLEAFKADKLSANQVDDTETQQAAFGMSSLTDSEMPADSTATMLSPAATSLAVVAGCA